MTTPIDWISPKNLAEESGRSKKYIENLLDTGEIVYAKNGKNNGGIMISITSWNKFWGNRRVIKK